MALRQTRTASAPCDGVARAYQRCTHPIWQPCCNAAKRSHNAVTNERRSLALSPLASPRRCGSGRSHAVHESSNTAATRRSSGHKCWPQMATQGDMRATRNLTSCLPNGERHRFADSRAEAAAAAAAAAAATPESIDHVGCQFQSSLSSAERKRLTSASLSARCDAAM